MENIDNNIFDFVVNEENEVMLLINAQDTEPNNACFHFDFMKRMAILSRNESDKIFLSDIDENILDLCSDSDEILVCELMIGENEEESQIVYAYSAKVIEHNIK